MCAPGAQGPWPAEAALPAAKQRCLRRPLLLLLLCGRRAVPRPHCTPSPSAPPLHTGRAPVPPACRVDSPESPEHDGRVVRPGPCRPGWQEAPPGLCRRPDTDQLPLLLFVRTPSLSLCTQPCQVGLLVVRALQAYRQGTGEPFDDEADDAYWRLQASVCVGQQPLVPCAPGSWLPQRRLPACPRRPRLSTRAPRLPPSLLSLLPAWQGFLPGELVSALDHATLQRLIKAYMSLPFSGA